MIRTVAKLYLTILVLGVVAALCLVRVDIQDRIWPLSHHPRLIAFMAVVVAVVCAGIIAVLSIFVAVKVVTEE